MTTWRAQLIVLVVAIWVATVLVWRSAPRFEAVTELHPHCDGTAAEFPVDNPLKVLSLNAQYMAGKGYVFFYDVDGGPDVRPSQASVALTVSKVADLLKREQPDVVMLQGLVILFSGALAFMMVPTVTRLYRRLSWGGG